MHATHTAPFDSADATRPALGYGKAAAATELLESEFFEAVFSGDAGGVVSVPADDDNPTEPIEQLIYDMLGAFGLPVQLMAVLRAAATSNDDHVSWLTNRLLRDLGESFAGDQVQQLVRRGAFSE